MDSPTNFNRSNKRDNSVVTYKALFPKNYMGHCMDIDFPYNFTNFFP